MHFFLKQVNMMHQCYNGIIHLSDSIRQSGTMRIHIRCRGVTHYDNCISVVTIEPASFTIAFNTKGRFFKGVLKE